MNSFTKEQMEYLDEQLRAVREKAGTCESVRALLMDIYRESLPDKSEKQAALMADEAIGTVTGFYEDLEVGRKDRDGLIERRLEELLEGQDLVRRCNTLQLLQHVLTAMDLEAMGRLMKGEVQKQELLGREPEPITAQQATQALEEELMEAVRATLTHSPFLLGVLSRQADVLEEIARDGSVELLLDVGEDELDYLSALAMLAYTGVKTGRFPHIPEDVTMYQIATMLCAAREQEKAAAVAEEEGWAESVLTEVLELIGLVAAIHIGFSLVGAGVGAAAAVALSPLGVLSMFFLGYCGIKALVKGYEWWKKDCGKVAGALVKTVRVVASGLRKLWEFARERVLPACADVLRGVSERLRHLVGGGKQAEQAHNGATELRELPVTGG